MRREVKVVPAILAKSEGEFVKKLRRVEGLVDTAQIDVMDGKFVPNKTWADIRRIRALETRVGWEVHLMVENVEQVMLPWLELEKVKRVLPHLEAIRDLNRVLELAKRFNKEIGLAINPETPLFLLKEVLDRIDMVLIMGVNPGFSKQAFQESVLAKISELRRLKPDLDIEVDGGVNMETAPRIIKAGANVLAAASAIFGAEDVEKAIRDLSSL